MGRMKRAAPAGLLPEEPMADRIVVLSIPQLRGRDVSPGGLASLAELSRRGSLRELTPAFPGTAAPSFATLVTGAGPAEHGIVGDTYFDRTGRSVAARPLPDSAVQAPRLWDRLGAARPGARTLLWFAPSSLGAAVAVNGWADGPTFATRPAGLAAGLIGEFGPYPSPSGEAPGPAQTAWILKTAAAAIAADAPDLAIVRVPYLGQVARRYGPDGRESGRAVRALEEILPMFLKALPRETMVVAATESIVTPVSAPIFPNLTLRALGLLNLRPAEGGGSDIDLEGSAAFALADHQVCHVYLNHPAQMGPVAAAFAGPQGDGIARVASLGQRAALGLDHPRSGEIVLIAAPDRWFAPNWWVRAEESPRSASGSTSGLAHATAGGLLLDPAHVQGSLGAPAPGEEELGVVVSSEPLADGEGPGGRLAARDLAALILRAVDHAVPVNGAN